MENQIQASSPSTPLTPSTPRTASSSSNSVQSLKLHMFLDYIFEKYKRRYDCNQRLVAVCIKKSFPHPGFIPETYAGNQLMKYLCVLCDQIAIKPVKCDTCQLNYCRNCAHLILLLSRGRKNQSITDINNTQLIDQQFDCISEFCVTDTSFKPLDPDDYYEYEIMNVKCIYDTCDYNNLYELSLRHYPECHHKDKQTYKFDTNNLPKTYTPSTPVHDQQLIQFINKVGNNEPDDNRRNLIAQNVYQQNLIASYVKTIEDINIAKESYQRSIEAIAAKYLDKIKNQDNNIIDTNQPTTNKRSSQQSTNRSSKKSKTPEGPWNTSRPCFFYRQANEQRKKLEARKAEEKAEKERLQKIRDDLFEKRMQNAENAEILEEEKRLFQIDLARVAILSQQFREKNINYYHHQQNIMIVYPDPKPQIKSVIIRPPSPSSSPSSSESMDIVQEFDVDMDEKDDDNNITIDTKLHNYHPIRTNLYDEYNQLIQSQVHKSIKARSKEINLRAKARRNGAYELIKNQHCERFISRIRPPRSFAWLIAANHFKLTEAGLNVCSIDIENIEIQVQVPGQSTKRKIQVPCWISIINSAGSIVYNEFIRHPKNSITNYLQSFHGLEWNHLKNASQFRFVREEVIKVLLQYKRIIVCGQAQDFANLFFNANDHRKLLPRIIDVNAYYNCRATKQSLGLKYSVFSLFGRHHIIQTKQHSPLIDATYAMFIYLIDYESIEKVHDILIKSYPVPVYKNFYGYKYPKNANMSGLIYDIMNEIGDWPVQLKVSNNQFTRREDKAKQAAQQSYKQDSFIEPIPNAQRKRPYKFVKEKYISN